MKTGKTYGFDEPYGRPLRVARTEGFEVHRIRSGPRKPDTLSVVLNCKSVSGAQWAITVPYDVLLSAVDQIQTLVQATSPPQRSVP